PVDPAVQDHPPATINADMVNLLFHTASVGIPNPFMWMENEEEYNEQVERELCEEEFLERCFQEMLDEEEREWFIPERDLPLQPLSDMEQQLDQFCAPPRGHFVPVRVHRT
uniref:Ataxin-2 C-terminal domain-containing protein n=1 Tax=Eptatretus burgeri TaxID=7764 RepID=A0A8C4N6J4_EPTBU